MKNQTDIQLEYLCMLNEEAQEKLQENVDIISSFKGFCLQKGVMLTDNNFEYIRTTGIVACYPNIVNHLCIDIQQDKDNLFNFNNLCTLYDKKKFVGGLLYSDSFILMAHPCFRRNYHSINNFAPCFVDLFWSETFDNIEPYIALDLDRVRVDVSECIYCERDTWFGAKFNERISSIPDGIIKLRPPLDLDSCSINILFNSTYSLDIKWTTKNNIRTFQSEEFKTDDVSILRNCDIFFPVRYLHAEFDLETNKFRHFDGAIHYYTQDEYYARRDSDFNYNSKNKNQIKTKSEKLFKLNGTFDVDIWVKYVSHFMPRNPLVSEYFEGKYQDV